MFCKPRLLLLILMAVANQVKAQPSCTLDYIYFTAYKTVGTPGTIWRMDTLGNNRVTLFNDAYYRQALDISSDGMQMTYTRRKNPNNSGGGDSLCICISQIDGSNEQVLYTVPSFQNTDVRSLRFNKNRTKILFGTYLDGYPSLIRDGDLFELDVATKQVMRLTFDPNFAKFAPEYSPDNTKITCTYLQSGWGAFPIPGKIMNADGSNIQTLNPKTNGNYGNTINAGFVYNANGTKFLYSHQASVGGISTLYTCNIDGTNSVALSYTSNSSLEYRYHPDGNRILVADGTQLRYLSASGQVLKSFPASANAYFRDIRLVRIKTAPTNSNHKIAICAGENYWGRTQSGIYRDTLVNAQNCDSIRTLELTVLPASLRTIDTSICSGSSIYGYTQPGIYTDKFISASGCDSTRILKLSFKTEIKRSIDSVACSGVSVYGYTQPGTYTDKFISASGCDSTRILKLSFKTEIKRSIDSIACSGVSVYGYTQPGTYTDKFISASGCDSIRILRLTYRPEIKTILDTAICFGKNIAGYTQTGTYTDKFISASGCDSTRTLRLLVLPEIKNTLDTTVCFGSSVNGYSQSGTYSSKFTSASGCDSIVLIKLTVLPPIKTELGKDTTLCSGDVIVLSPGNFKDYSWNNGSTASFIQTSAAGLYTVTVTDTNGCKAFSSMRIYPPYPKPSKFLPASGELCVGTKVEVKGFSNYLWNDGSKQSSINITKSGVYALEVTNLYGCKGIDSANYTIKNCPDVFIPDAFTPNRDGLNDVFKPVIYQEVSNYRLEIFSRWGQLIFSSTNPQQGWDGTFKSIQQPSGTFIYVVQFTNYAQQRILRKGGVMLMR